MATQYRCQNDRRRALILQRGNRGDRPLNGIDYLEVSRDQQTLIVYFLHDLAATALDTLTPDNLTITGGTRLQNLQVDAVTRVANELRVQLDQPGDYSPYRLQLVRSASNPEPPAGVDSQLAAVEFRFWLEDISEFDCETPEMPFDGREPPPVIDYLAKDYASFRQLMLDRLSVIMPEWRERNPADIGVMVVELLAYAADHLSYYQDAVATEAYLGTCRRRVSMRRHSRLLDYLMHDGCNARTWVVLRCDPTLNDWPEAGITLLGPAPQQGRPGVQLLTQTDFRPGSLEFNSEEYLRALNAGAQVFETLHDITLFPVLDVLHFYTWEDEQCRLPRGATQATLVDDTRGDESDPDSEGLSQCLEAGRILIFQEERGAMTGDSRDADLAHRHAVRLTRVRPLQDPLNGKHLVEIEWDIADALPFDLPISGVDAAGIPFESPLSVAYGNVVLADAGRTRAPEVLNDHPDWHRRRPRLATHPLTRQGYVETNRGNWQPFDVEAPARAAMQWQLRDAKPAIRLWERDVPTDDQPGGAQWQPQPDLLISDRFARDFVVESEADGRAWVRFGQGQLGKVPSLETPLIAVYRTGNGTAGNVGAGTLVNIVLQAHNLRPSAQRETHLQQLKTVLTPTNPLPAQRGVDPEPIDKVRLDAPQEFREVLKRAVTEQDYERLTERYPGVERAVAQRRWTGSRHSIFIAVDLAGGRALDQSFKDRLLTYLDEFRLIGHDLAIASPRFVPLNIGLTIRVNADYFRNAVKTALVDAFSNRVLSTGQRGFFHPDRFTFGQSVYLSQVVARAMQVDGVQAATVTQFERLGDSGAEGLTTGVLRFEPLEIAQLDNLPSLPENGRLELRLEGGL
jgi:hypothetical protein